MAKRVFRLEIECENAAFDEAPGYEIARILRNAGSQMEQGFIDGTLRDANGNKVGRFELADEQEAEAEIDRILARLARERWEAARLPVSGGGREGAMTEIEALGLVRNMAYDFDNQGNVLHDLIAQTGDSGSAVKDQTRAIDAIDAMLFRLKDGSQNDAAMERYGLVKKEKP